MIQRELLNYLKKVAQQYPVVAVTGPRQSGKTTLVRQLWADKPYVSLEDLESREFAETDPRGFLASFPEGAVIDEVQYVPHLFSYIQTRVDATQRLGEFVLTGSQNFLLLEKITQSLAGRVAITHLLPLSLGELQGAGFTNLSTFDVIYQGFYPRIYAFNLGPSEWYRNYTMTYLERDIRQIQHVTDLSKFQTFLRLCAGRIGQLLNISSLASDCGIDQATAKRWLSILEASFIITLLRPHFKNFNKRLVKQPKLYFIDPGLACYLLGITSSQDVENHYLRGGLFENMIIMELIKARFNQGKESNLYFWRDSHGHEIDVILDQGSQLVPLEIKSGQTINTSFFSELLYWQKLTETEGGYLVYGGADNYTRQGFQVVGWSQVGGIA